MQLRLKKNKKNIYIYIYINSFFLLINHSICGAKRFGDFGPFHIRPMAHAEEEEIPEDEQRESRLLGYTAEDDPSADQNHRRGKRHTARGSPLEHPKGSSEPSGSAVGAW